MNLNRGNKSMFDHDEQMAVIENNKNFVELMKTATDVKSWNKLREKVSREFKGSTEDMLALFGYLDGILFVEKFK